MASPCNDEELQSQDFLKPLLLWTKVQLSRSVPWYGGSLIDREFNLYTQIGC